MNLKQLFTKLANGHLRELAITGEGSGVVPISSQGKLAYAANEALAALYARFPLAERTAIIQTYAGLYEYRLEPEYALSSGSAQPIKYIVDTIGPTFDGHVLMITDIFDANHVWIPMNDRNNIVSWHTKGNMALVMDYPVADVRYFVNYRKAHPELPIDTDEIETQTLEEIEIDIPAQLEAAFMHHIASGIYGGMSMESSIMKTTRHLDRYEAECIFHENNNTFNGSVAETNRKPYLRGWP